MKESKQSEAVQGVHFLRIREENFFIISNPVLAVVRFLESKGTRYLSIKLLTGIGRAVAKERSLKGEFYSLRSSLSSFLLATKAKNVTAFCAYRPSESTPEEFPNMKQIL